MAEQLNISIGRVPLSLRIPEQPLFNRARERYAQFLCDSPGALPIFLHAPSNSGSHAPAGERFTFDWQDASLFLSAGAAQFVGVRHEWGLDSLIRVLLSVLLAPLRGFLLHAATVVRDGRAYVFTGKSGAGKSTVASLSPPGSVLTDEISLLRFANGSWRAYGTPFWGEFRAEGANVHAPLAGLYFLHQSPDNRLEDISSRDALRTIFANVLFFSRDAHMTGDLFCALEEFVQTVPCRRLFFRKDNRFWSLLAK